MTMHTCSRKFEYGLFLAFTLAATCVSRAVVPEPDAVVYGRLYHRFDQLLTPSQSNQICVIAQVNGTTIASNVLSSGAKTFLLRIPMDDGLEPRQANTAKAGDQVHFFIRNNQTLTQFECVQSSSQPWILPVGRASVVSNNLAVQGNVAGVAPDSNHDGVPNYWANNFHLTAPKAAQVLSNAAFTVQGSANGLFATVWYQLNGGDWTAASTTNGYTNWTAGVMLLPGTNSIKVYATDAAGNCFPTNTTTCFFGPLISFKGVYNGLFHETNAVNHETSGFFTFTLSDSGAFTGRILIGGAAYNLTGRFDSLGRARVLVPRLGNTSLTVDFELDLTPGDNHDVSGTVADGSWIAALLGDRAAFSALSNPAPVAGSYTLVIPGAPDSAVSPGGDGIGVVTVTRGGLVKLTGTLADGAPMSQSVGLSKNGNWPLYLSLYSGKGSLLSWVTFSNQTSSSFSGNLSWIKTGDAGGVYYPGGFSNDLSVIGSSYLSPSGTRVLNLTNAQVILSAGNLSDPLTRSVTLSTNNLITVTLPTTNKLSLKISGTTGKVSGSFLHPQTGLITPIKGVVLQQQNTVQGFFLGTNQSGRLLLSPAE